MSRKLNITKRNRQRMQVTINRIRREKARARVTEAEATRRVAPLPAQAQAAWSRGDGSGTASYPTPSIIGVARPRVEFIQFADCAAVFVNGRRDAVLRDESTAVYAFCQTLAALGAIELVRTDQQRLTFLV